MPMTIAVGRAVFAAKAKEASRAPAYEILNPSFGDMNLEQQIAAGVNDWQADGEGGRSFVRGSKHNAQAARATFEAVSPLQHDRS